MNITNLKELQLMFKGGGKINIPPKIINNVKVNDITDDELYKVANYGFNKEEALKLPEVTFEDISYEGLDEDLLCIFNANIYIDGNNKLKDDELPKYIRYGNNPVSYVIVLEHDGYGFYHISEMYHPFLFRIEDGKFFIGIDTY